MEKDEADAKARWEESVKRKRLGGATQEKPKAIEDSRERQQIAEETLRRVRGELEAAPTKTSRPISAQAKSAEQRVKEERKREAEAALRHVRGDLDQAPA